MKGIPNTRLTPRILFPSWRQAWDELSKAHKAAALTLGYCAETWDNDIGEEEEDGDEDEEGTSSEGEEEEEEDEEDDDDYVEEG